MAVGELCTEILHTQKFEQSYVTGYYVTHCLRSLQLARGTEHTAQCQSTRPFSRVAIGKGSGYARLGSKGKFFLWFAGVHARNHILKLCQNKDKAS